MTEGRAGKLIIISNRLPMSLKETVGAPEATGGDFRNSWNRPGMSQVAATSSTWTLSKSSGGLVSALRGLENQEFTWVGWPGRDVPEHQRAEVTALFENEGCRPVYLADELTDLYYDGFSNSVMWPLFHYLPPEISNIGERWAAYKQVNEAFARQVAGVLQDGDMVWVHDYHLMLMPKMLREMVKDRNINFTIGFFLHTPFPSSEAFRILPMRSAILEGVVGADLIGFHTMDYARHFSSAIVRLLGLPSDVAGIRVDDRIVHVGAFPIGIETTQFTTAASSNEQVLARVAELKKRFEGKKIIIGVDRLDYIKGVDLKLLALERLLQERPEWKDRLVLIQIAVPSRTDVPEYQQLRRRVNELAGKINGEQGSVDHSPVHLLHTSVPFTELVALYAAADACVITSIRDGMNLVSYEYLMSQEANKGVLVLSEFAGAAQSFDGAQIVNPFDIDNVVSALHTALTMPPEERAVGYAKLHDYVTKNTAAYWGHSFVSALQKIGVEARRNMHACRKLTVAEVKAVLPTAAGARVFFFALDGALVPHVKNANAASPSGEIVDAITRLAANERNHVYVVSGRSRAQLAAWFPAALGVGLIAEHGYYYRHGQAQLQSQRVELAADRAASPGSNKVVGAVQHHDGWIQVQRVDDSWMSIAQPILDFYMARTPGSKIELKERSYTWHYRAADPAFGIFQARQLQSNLGRALKARAVNVVPGTKTIEVLPMGISLAGAVKRVLADMDSMEINVNFVLGLGNDAASDSVLQPLLDAESDWAARGVTPLAVAMSKTPTTRTDFFLLPKAVHSFLEELLPEVAQ